MCHCITPQALLQALVRRVANEGYVPTARDLHGLVGSGRSVPELRAALATLPSSSVAALDAAFPESR